MWERVRTQGGAEGWIKQADISEDDGTPVKKIVYDRWDRFFTLIDLCKYGNYRCEKKDDFLKEFGLRLGESGKVSEAMKEHKELLLPAYYKKESEWLDSDELTNALISKYTMVRDAIMQERTDCEFWNGLNEKLPRECYYFNPKGFLNHLDKVAGVPEFNPYEGKLMTINNYMDPKTGRNLGQKTFEAKMNPGFSPYIGDGKTIYEGYANCSQWFNENSNPNTEYRHEGVDLVVDYKDCDNIAIKSFIYGSVIAAGDQGNYSYGNYLIIKADEQFDKKNKYYLLGHLSLKHEKLSVGSFVAPNMIVGYTGNTGHCFGQEFDMQGSTNSDKRALGYGAHLHLQMYLSPDDAKTFLSSILLSNGKIVIKRNEETFIVNPFDYNEKRFSEE